MSEKEFQNIMSQAKKVSLGENKKNEIRSRLVEFMHYHPARELSALRLIDTRSHIFKNPLFILGRAMAIALIIMLVLGGGISLASEQALPGDPLYAVKVGVNEEVRGWLAVSEEADAKWETRRIERRLEEAEELAAGGEFNAEARAKIESNFKEHADRVEARIAKFGQKEQAQAVLEASSRFEASLQAHAEILTRFSDEDESVSVHTEALRAKVKARIVSAARARAEAEGSLSVKENGRLQEAAEGKAKAAENKLSEAERFVASSRPFVSARAILEAEAKLQVSKTAIAAGKAKLEADLYGEAFASFQGAIRLAEEAKILVAGERRIESRLENFKMDIEADRSDKAPSEAEIGAEIQGDAAEIEGRGEVRINIEL